DGQPPPLHRDGRPARSRASHLVRRTGLSEPGQRFRCPARRRNLRSGADHRRDGPAEPQASL
ncbi:MAG: hypothetical protein AVDCRST_MAG75-1576, partial [uncultured Propionibacteriaceae bacterium]